MVSSEEIINNLDEAVFLFDKKGRLIFANKAGEEFFGKGFKEMKHKQIKHLFSGANDIAVLLQKTISEGRSFNCRDMEVDLGRPANINLNVSPFYSNNNTEGALLFIRENLSLSNREDYPFDTMLYLIGSIAHEIKNPLSGIKGAAQILRQSASSPEAEECVSLILKESERLNSVLVDYLTMTRKPVFNQLNIHEVIEHTLKVMGPAVMEKKIQVVKSYDPSLPNISGDEGKLLQVFINILKNAVEAMDTPKSLKVLKKVLNISTRPSNEYMVIYEGEEVGKKNMKSKKQRWVVINIEDSGKGIPSDEIDRIFLPFYTKKEGGSGLGLALSKKIIKDHGGAVKIKSRAGRGTTVSVYLPLQTAKEIL